MNLVLAGCVRWWAIGRLKRSVKFLSKVVLPCAQVCSMALVPSVVQWCMPPKISATGSLGQQEDRWSGPVVDPSQLRATTLRRKSSCLGLQAQYYKATEGSLTALVIDKATMHKLLASAISALHKLIKTRRQL